MKAIKNIPPVSRCGCSTCRSACETSPGWLIPDDLPRLARLLRCNPRQLVHRFLGFDRWYGDDGDTIHVLAPAGAHHRPGETAPNGAAGRCVFLDASGRCSVYAARPFECRRYHHRLSDKQKRALHRATMRAWASVAAQRMIRRWYGGEPPVPTLDDEGW